MAFSSIRFTSLTLATVSDSARTKGIDDFDPLKISLIICDYNAASGVTGSNLSETEEPSQSLNDCRTFEFRT